MKDPSVNFYDVQKEFNREAKRFKRANSSRQADHSERKMPGYMQYKRWEWFMSPRVAPSGDRTIMAKAIHDEIVRQNALKKNPSVLQAGNWSLLGSINTIPANGGGAGRINTVAFHPSSPNIMYAGSPGGGLWKTLDGGITWSTTTDQLPVVGISDIAIDPLNPNIVYIATGDGDNVDTYSAGVMKSTDGGATWNLTGLSYLLTQTASIHCLVIHPTNPNVLFAGTGTGLFKSNDAGNSWVKVLNAKVNDIEFKPGNPNVMFAAGSSLYRSINGGQTFSTVTSGAPGSGASRIAVAVTPADTNYVYLLAGSSNGQGLMGVYRSVNGGQSFTLQANSPNLLGWESSGQDQGGQAWYDLSIAVSPTNKDHVVTGGVNVWSSSDGGVNWSIIGHWWGDNAPYVHADVHDLAFYPGIGSTIFAGCDGGVFKTTDSGVSWTDLSNQLQIGQFYRLGNSATNASKVIQGWQDNGTGLWDSGTWSRVYGGDGMECFIDWSDPNVLYTELYYGYLRRSMDGGLNWTNIESGINEVGDWVTPWCQDPKNSSTLYAGFQNVWKSTDQGTSWNKISNLGIGKLLSLTVAPSDPNYIYTASTTRIYKTTNGGSSWTDISSGLSSQVMSYITVNRNDPNRIWVSISGYFSAYKVFQSTDGGATWVNRTYDLPNLPVNCVVVDTTSAVEGIYIGTDNGVYYLDSTRTSWLPFNNGLPNVVVNELEIHYGSGKIRAATFGRGLWEASLFDPNSQAPAANFTANKLLGCPGMVVQFKDTSSNNPTSWQWSFPGGNPASSIVQNPVVTYTAAGTWNNIKLVASNSFGSDSVVRYSYIGVSPNNGPTTNPAGSLTICGSSVVINSSMGSSYKWLPNGQSGSFVNANASGSYQVIVTDLFGCKDTSAPVNVVIAPISSPTITANGDTLICSPAFSYQWYQGNSTMIAGATSQSYVGTPGNPYYVVVTNASGCSKSSAIVLSGVGEWSVPGLEAELTPTINVGEFDLVLDADHAGELRLRVLDISGKIMEERNVNVQSGKQSIHYRLNISPGFYFLVITSADNARTMRKFIVRR